MKLSTPWRAINKKKLGVGGGACVCVCSRVVWGSPRFKRRLEVCVGGEGRETESVYRLAVWPTGKWCGRGLL